ncbi:MAG: hypothetical protein H6604_08910 [Flavobacteriales bacterium]|nr:hypothetical protein [Flavobacteriales bacterium]
MKLTSIIFLITSFIFSQNNFGSFASAVYLEVNGNKEFYSCSGEGIDKISGNDFQVDLGTFKRKSGKLKLAGAEIKSWRDKQANVCKGELQYVLYKKGKRPENIKYHTLELPHDSDCAGFGPFGMFKNFSNSEGRCGPRDQKWKIDSKQNDLTRICAGEYTLEVFFVLYGSSTSQTACNQKLSIRSKTGNYKVHFKISDSFSVVSYKKTVKQGSDVKIYAQPNPTNDTYTYIWNTDNFSSTERNPLLKNVQKSQTYYVTATNSCGLEYQAKVQLEVLPNQTKVEKKIEKPKVVTTPKPVEKVVAINEVEEKPKSIPKPKVEPKKEVERIKPKTEEEIITEKRNTRKDVLANRYNYKNGKLVFEIYDYGQEDGDLISLFYNDKLIFHKVEIKKEKQRFGLTLDKNSSVHRLVFVANNLGEVAPNTGELKLILDGKTYYQKLATDENENALLEFRKL